MSAAEELEPTLTARATVAATEIVEGLRFATLEEAQRILASSAAVPDVGPGAITKLTDLIKQKAASALMKAAYSTTTEAIAQGRTETAELYADEVALVEYSALLDNATCDACRSADGKVVKMGSGEYGRLQPPNARCRGRSRCRCVYIYVLKDEPRSGPAAGGGPPKLAPIIPLFPQKPLLALPAPAIIPISKSPIPLKPKLPPSVKTTPTGLVPIPLGPPKPIVVAQPAPPKERVPRGPAILPHYRADVAAKSHAFIGQGQTSDELENSMDRGALKAKIAKDVSVTAVKDPAFLKRVGDARVAIYEADTGQKITPVIRERINDPDSIRADIEARTAGMNRTWAQTSVDQHKDAIAAQIAAAEEFGLGRAAMTKLKAQVSRTRFGDQAWKDAQALLAQPGEKELMKVTLRAMHENTQAAFKAAGITHVAVARGMSIDLDKLPANVRDGLGRTDADAGLWMPKRRATPLGDPPQVASRVAMQPMSSTAADLEIAQRFAGYSDVGVGGVAVVLRGTIPVELIIGTARTGMGCLHEFEMVTLAGSGKWTVELAHPEGGGVYIPPAKK